MNEVVEAFNRANLRKRCGNLEIFQMYHSEHSSDEFKLICDKVLDSRMAKNE